jgi:hypothetical protein
MAQNASEDRSAMSFPDLVSWAWTETPSVHRNTTNLIIHIFAVPLFVLGHVLLVAGLLVNPWFLAGATLSIVVSLAAQRYGHSLEDKPVQSFTSAGDFVRRLYAEQFCNFWRFLLSGQWYASVKSSRSGA